MQKLLILLLGLTMLLGACAKGGQLGSNGMPEELSLSNEATEIASEDTKVSTCYDPGIQSFGEDFQIYLNQNGNGDLTGFGGSNTKAGDCAVVKQPVIFIHGNSDSADGSALPGDMGGWKRSRDYFLSKGYKTTELYAVNFGLAGMIASGSGSLNYNSVDNVSKVNRFINAVLRYTGASKVDIISHSLGVTVVRRAVKGGNYCDSLGRCANLGDRLDSRIDTNVGIAGGNRGLNTCGVWPLSVWMPGCGPHGFSIGNPFLSEINGGYSIFFGYLGSNWKVGSYTYSIISYVDELTCAPSMPTTCYIWGVHTSRFKGENGSKAYYSYPYGHMGIKNETASVQYEMVVNHRY